MEAAKNSIIFIYLQMVLYEIIEVGKQDYYVVVSLDLVKTINVSLDWISMELVEMHLRKVELVVAIIFNFSVVQDLIYNDDSIAVV